MAKRQRSATQRAKQADRIRSRPARGRILEAARTLAATRGYEGIRVGELAAMAKVSRETFYTHFADKRACVAEATEPRLGQIEAQCRAAIEDGESWAAPIMEAVDHALGDRFGSEVTPRGRIITEMLEQVRQKGYAATRLVDVIKDARVSYPAFYRHFPGKAECFAAAYANLLVRIEQRVTPAQGTTGIEAKLTDLARIFAAEPDTARILLIEAGQLPVEAADEGLSGSRSLAELLERLLAFDDVPSSELAGELRAGAVLEVMRSATLAGETKKLPRQVAALVGLVAPVSEAAPANPPRPLRPRPAGSRGTRSSKRLVAAAG